MAMRINANLFCIHIRVNYKKICHHLLKDKILQAPKCSEHQSRLKLGGKQSSSYVGIWSLRRPTTVFSRPTWAATLLPQAMRALVLLGQTAGQPSSCATLLHVQLPTCSALTRTWEHQHSSRKTTAPLTSSQSGCISCCFLRNSKAKRRISWLSNSVQSQTWCCRFPQSNFKD